VVATHSTAMPPAPPAAPAGGAPAADGAAAPAAGGWSISGLLRMLMMYWMVSSFFNKGSNPQPAEVRDVATGAMVMVKPHRNAWPDHTPYSMYVFVHDQPELDVTVHTAATLHPRSLLWFEGGLRYGWENEPRLTERALNWTMTAGSWPLQHLQANGSLFAHVYLVREHTPLFPFRGINDVAGEAAYAHVSHDALVLGSEGTALSTDGDAASSSGSVVPPLVSPLPSDTTSAAFREAFVPNVGYKPQNIVHRSVALNVYKPAPKIVDKKNLLGVGVKQSNSTEIEVLPPQQTEQAETPAEVEDEEEDMLLSEFLEEDSTAGAAAVAKSSAGAVSKSKKKSAVRGAPWLNYWKPFLHIRPIPDWTVFPVNGIPAEMKDDYNVDPLTSMYDPPIYFDYFWLLQDQLIIVNDTVSTLALNLSTSPLSLIKWRLEQQMETSWQMQQSYGLQEADGRESEMLKKMIMDTNIYLLAITFAVSILHAVFDFLAFKNDVKFWKEAKSMRGLSTRSIVMNAGCQLIIFLYLLDNDTSFMILMSSGVGCAIEIWKVRKAVTIRVERVEGRVLPRVRILSKTESEDKAEEDKTEEEKEIEQHAKYDGEAMRYLSYALYPLVAAYAGYSLYYDSHKSWYSFILSVLTGCVYTFGFIMMCPQLYINYKLKSVAHLPWRMLTYKALNTFIDDLFAFVITMPTLHRLSCFRDDLIFFIFLYQKWAYRVDFKRVNEFGAVFISEEEQRRIEEEDRKKILEQEQKAQQQPQAQEEQQADGAEDSEDAQATEQTDDADTDVGTDEATLRHRAQLNSVD